MLRGNILQTNTPSSIEREMDKEDIASHLIKLVRFKNGATFGVLGAIKWM